MLGPPQKKATRRYCALSGPTPAVEQGSRVSDHAPPREGAHTLHSLTHEKLLTDLRSSFWFIPALIVALAAALALGAVELDAAVGEAALARHPRLFGAGAEGTRQLLSAIASSTITVAGVVFSITIVALSLTAAQYSLRYIQAFETHRLADYARACHCTVRMERAAGDFVVAGEMLLSVAGGDPDEAQVKILNSAYAINTYRDVKQDPAFGVQQLVDIALKALSPGINDTATARNSLDYLTAVLFELARHPLPAEERHSEGGRVLLVAINRSFDSYIASTFDPIRRSSVDNVDMMVHSLRALARIAHSFRGAACRGPVAKQLEAVEQTIAGGTYVVADKSKLESGVQEVLHALSVDAA